jgi:hypothetical protein
VTVRILILMLAITVGAGSASAQAPGSRAEAEELFVSGQAAYDRQHFAAALVAWQRSYELSREPGLLFNIAQAYRLRAQAGDCTRAIERYREFIQLAPTAPQRASAEGFIRSIERCAAAEAAAAPAATAPVGPAAPVANPAGPVDAGRVGATRGVAPAPRDASPGRTWRIAGIGTAGAGLVLIATGMYFGARASGHADDVAAACKAGCIWDDISDLDSRGRSAATLERVGYGVGAAAVVAGGVLYVLGWREASRAGEARPPISVTAQRDGGAVTWSGSW